MRRRNLTNVEWARLEGHRWIATRHDKLAASYLAFIQLAAIQIWL
jgi:hypothetical protein